METGMMVTLLPFIDEREKCFYFSKRNSQLTVYCSLNFFTGGIEFRDPAPLDVITNIISRLASCGSRGFKRDKICQIESINSGFFLNASCSLPSCLLSTWLMRRFRLFRLRLGLAR